jgi:hypothetical protein
MQALSVNAARLLCGLATVFDAPSSDGTRWSAESFARWLELSSGLEMRLSHGAVHRVGQMVQLPSGQIQFQPGTLQTSVGRWFRFAAVTAGSTPAGLLALGGVDSGTVGDGVLGAVRDGTLSGLSLGADVWHDQHGDAELVVPTECSLTSSPAFEQALVIGTGQAAVNVFEMLSGQRVEVSA